MEHVQTQAEWEGDMSEQILALTRNELYMELRYLDSALCALKWQREDSLAALATDGMFLYYSAAQLMRVFPENPKFLSRAYLHTVLHCIFSHLWVRGNREPLRWNVACDIMVEWTIDRMGKRCMFRPLTWLRQELYRELEEKKRISAAGVYADLEKCPADRLETLHCEFYTDSHQYWPEEEKASPYPDPAKKMWDTISRKSQMELEKRGQEPDEGEQQMIWKLKAQRSRRSYREFLRKFAVLREEMRCDPDEFDLNFYTYGLRLYGNMPLIEAVETRESMKIQEFAVVVDTSYSTSGELVKGFLRETFGILTEQDSFLRNCHIRILQCDDAVRMDEKITNLKELEGLLERFTLAGGGGTDFRPAFEYVDRLRENGELTHLRGLLYFTDGKGIYPARRPDYDTAFLFLGEYEEQAVPPWAMQMQLM